jgi:hypothetical protein
MTAPEVHELATGRALVLGGGGLVDAVGARAAMGRNPLNPANRPVAARAGLAQGSEIAEEVRASWA